MFLPDPIEPHLNIVPSVVWQGYRMRAVWGTLYRCPLEETFHEFILSLLGPTLGEDWWKKQLTLSPKKKHVIMKWYESCRDWMKEHQTDENKNGEGWKALPSGEVQALMSLAYDMYCLQVVNRLPDFLVNRLRNRDQFQGVRYEIAVAAIVARAGFDIDFLDEEIKSKRHCEFIAKHKYTGIEIGIEAKSRHRKGVLHQDGEFNYNENMKGDIWKLVEKALSQRPTNIPYFIFVDLNLPPTPDIPWDKKPWFNDIKTMLDNYGTPSPENPDPFNVLIVTNFSYYYAGNEEISPPGEYMPIVSKYPEVPLPNPYVFTVIWKSLERYSYIPTEI